MVAKAGEPALRASTFLACSKVSFPLGLMQSAAAMTGDIACPVSGSRTGSKICCSLAGPPSSCFSALRHPAKSRCKFDRLPSYPRSRIKGSSALPVRMPFSQLCVRYSSKYQAEERLRTARFRSGGVSNCSHFATLRRGNPVRRPISLQISPCCRSAQMVLNISSRDLRCARRDFRRLLAVLMLSASESKALPVARPCRFICSSIAMRRFCTI